MTVSSSPPIRVVLVDDHTMVRKGLALFLKAFDDMELAGEAESGASAIQLCEKIQPDVVLMDLVMPGMDGVEATRKVKDISPRTQIIVLTSYHQDEHIFPALQAGAISYLLKDVKAGEGFQFLRQGYFCLDEKLSKEGKPVFNRTVPLRDTWAKLEQSMKGKS